MARPRTLSHQVESISYIHADDGLPYRHDFTAGDSDILLRQNGTVEIRNKRKKLWDTFSVDGREQPFLVNPRGTKPTRRRGPMAKRKRKSGRRRNASGHFVKASAAPRRRNPPVRRVKRRRRNPVVMARTQRRRRRNPPTFNVSSITRSVTQGLIDGALVTGGRVLARLASSQFSYENGSVMDSLVEVAAALAIGMVGPRFIGADRARFLMAGAFSSPIETLANEAGIPKLSQLLGATSPANTTAIYPAADGAAPSRNLMLGGYAPRTPVRAALSTGPRLNGYAPRSNVSMMS